MLVAAIVVPLALGYGVYAFVRDGAKSPEAIRRVRFIMAGYLAGMLLGVAYVGYVSLTRGGGFSFPPVEHPVVFGVIGAVLVWFFWPAPAPRPLPRSFDLEKWAKRDLLGTHPPGESDAVSRPGEVLEKPHP